MINVDELLSKPTSEISTWIEFNAPKHEFPWLTIAEGAIVVAYQASPRESKLTYGEIAIRAYQLARLYCAASFSRTIEFSEMNFRAYLISQLGISRKTEILNPHFVLEWFHSWLETIDLTKLILDRCELARLPIKDIVILRDLKSRLQIIEMLHIAGCELGVRI